jgi:23S rRNA (uracil1939-C5)-methyltransferase
LRPTAAHIVTQEERSVAARCPHFGICGGCSFQDVPYPAQLRLKEKFFIETLEESARGGVEPILPSPDVWHYRNKMEFAFGHEEEHIALGLHPRRRLWEVVDLKTCEILSEDADLLLEAARRWAAQRNLTAYHSRRQTGELRHLVIREGKNTGERMVNLLSTSDLKSADGFLEALSATGVRLDTVLWSRTDGVADVAQGEPVSLLSGQGWIQERIGGLEFKVTPYGFMQTNTHAAEGMVKLLLEWMDVTPAKAGVQTGFPLTARGNDGMLVDVYCGSGLLGLSLAGRFGSVAGIELNPVSIEAALDAAALNGIRNATFVCGPAEAALPKILGARDPVGSLTIIVDPPRVGLHKKVIAALIAARAQALVYVSCNPVSLASDLQVLSPYYSVERIQPMDFYPHTPHIESMTLLRSFFKPPNGTDFVR